MSYRREDSAGWAGRLVDDLAEKFGAANVFQDIHSITAGMDFVDAINETLQKTDCALVVIGPFWLSLRDEEGGRRLDDAGDYVRLEVATALRRGSPVIPVLVGGARMPTPASLPEELKPLARRNAAELTDKRWSYDLDQLARAISGYDRPGGGARAPNAPADGATGGRAAIARMPERAEAPWARRKWAVPVAAVLVVLSIAVALNFENRGPPPSPAPAPAGPTRMAQCPDNLTAFNGSDETVICGCAAEQVARSGPVWGTDVYTSDSATCRAALHAGAVGRQGGEVTLRMLPGQPRYPGTTRNGIASSNYGNWNASYRFEGATHADLPR